MFGNIGQRKCYEKASKLYHEALMCEKQLERERLLAEGRRFEVLANKFKKKGQL